LEIPFDLGMMIVRLPTSWVEASLAHGLIVEIPLFVYIALVVLCAIRGFRSTWTRAGAASALYVALYCCALLIWPFPTERFLVPILPLLLAALLRGVGSYAIEAWRRIESLLFVDSQPAEAHSTSRAPGLAAVAVLSVGSILASL